MKFFFPVLTLLFLQLAQGQNWQLIGFEDYEIEHVYAKGDTVWVSTMDSIYKSEVFYSINGGDLWQKINDTDTLINGWLKLLRVGPYKSTEIYARTLNGRGLKSIDAGQSWEILFPGLEPWPQISLNVKEIHVSPHSKNTIFGIVEFSQGGYSEDNLYRSFDGGTEWEHISTEFPGSSHGSTFVIAYDPIDSLKMYAAVDDHFGAWFFYVSLNGGMQWSFRSQFGRYISQIIPKYLNPDTLFAFPGNYMSVDKGNSWNRILKEIIIPDSTRQPWVASAHQMSNHPFEIFTSIVKWDSAFSVRETLGILKKAPGLDSWTIIPGSENLNLSSLLNPHILFIDPITNRLYIGTKKGLHGYNLITSIDETDYNPKEFKLHQNYPNPFNPETIINYELQIKNYVTLVVYNNMGQKIKTLVRGQKNAGKHSVTFDADNMPSGVYFYRLKTSSGFSQSRKMILIK